MIRAIYIVDDDATVRASLHGLLAARPGFAIYSFPSGDRFLAGKEMLGPGTVLLDHNMPGASGMDVLEALDRDPRFATILVTGRGDIALAVRAMKAGALDFLEKPYDPAAMIEMVDAAAARLEAGRAEAAQGDAANARIDGLSPRERDVLAGLIAGQANKLIAHKLGISPRTVEIYRANMMATLGVRSLAEALRVAFAAGLVARG
jgi:two-component system response regulator FixJ